MEFFTNKKFLFKLIATLCICLTVINFACMPKANAASLISEIGGQLLDPLVDLLLVLGDGVMEIIQTNIMDAGTGLIFDNAKSKWIDGLKFVFKAIIAIVAGVIIVAAASALAALIPVVGGIIAAGISSGIIQAGTIFVVYSLLPIDWLPDKIYLPTLLYGPEEIFSGKILLFDPNVFSPKDLKVEVVDKDDPSDIETMSAEEWKEKVESANTGNDTVKSYFYEQNGETIRTSVNNSAYELKNVISKWYYTIRNVALIALMAILVYVGIRILLSTIASEKAKYKQFLWDWLVAMCLIFVMHYFMVFLNVFVENVVTLLAGVTKDNFHTAIIEGAPDKLIEDLKSQGFSDSGDDRVIDGNNILWPTNLMGKIRVEAQNKNGTSAYVGYAICYIVLVFYTVSFTFVYLKRLLYLLFLTVISPLVAMTYPLDKIRDGQAQAFNMWLKEYIYNLLIQPFHLLLYVIFISMAFDLAGKNMIYSLVVIGFMLPAEKFLRNMFGFNKASTPGFLSGAAGTAMTLTGIKSLANFAKGGKGSGNGKNADGNGKIQQANTDFLNRKADNDKKELKGLVGDNGNDGDDPPSDGSNGGDGRQPPTTPGGNGDGDGNNGGQPPTTPDGDNDNGGNPDFDGDAEFPDDPELTWEEQLGNFGTKVADKAEDLISTPINGAINLKNKASQKLNTIRNRSLGQNAKALVFTGGRTIAKGAKFTSKALKERGASAAKDTIKYGVGGALGLAGVAAGIASGNPENVLKYGASAAYSGSAIGEGVANRVGTGLQAGINDFKDKRDEKLRNKIGEDEYNRLQNEKKDKEFLKNEKMRKLYAHEFNLKYNGENQKEIDRIMKQAVHFREYGVTDNDIIIKALKLNDNKRATKNNIAAAKLATVSKTEKDLGSSLKRYGSLPGVTSRQVKDMEENIRKINGLLR